MKINDEKRINIEILSPGMKLKQKRDQPSSKHEIESRKDSVKQMCRCDAFAIFSIQVHRTYCDRLMLFYAIAQNNIERKSYKLINLMGWQLLSQPGAEIETFQH